MAGTLLEDDLPYILDTDEFAYQATWTPSGGDPTTVDGFWTDANLFINPYTGEVESNIDATFFCKASDMAGAKQGDALVVNSISYTIFKVPSSQSNITAKFGLKIDLT